jgi:hypothetical protein
MTTRGYGLLLGALLVAAAPATAAAQVRIDIQFGDPFRTGYERGVRAGEGDVRRGQRFNFEDESEFRRGDAGWRGPHGAGAPARDRFRQGFAAGYRDGYLREAAGGSRGGYGGSRRDGGYGWYGYGGGDPAWRQGYADGYKEGRDAGDDRRRFEPERESRFRDADRGYEREYGPRDFYRARYREAFLAGYARGYDEGLYR